MTTEDKDTLVFNDIEIELTFKSIKNIHLSVHPPFGRVTLSAPAHIDREQLRVYLTTKLSWIRKEQKKIRLQEREPQHLFISGESHYLFGKRYLLKITEATSRPKVILHHSKIELVVPFNSSQIYREEKLYQWYRKQLRKVLQDIIDKQSTIMNVCPQKYGIRKVKTKWGSCNDSAQSLWFNIELVKKPIECIEYIVIHELVHLLERHHNKNFVTLMNKYLPNWQLRKKLLNELPI